MKKNNVRIKNLNKKLLAGALIITFAASPLTGCANVNNKVNDDNSQIVINNTMDSSFVRSLKVIEIKTEESNSLFLTVRTRIDDDNNTNYYYYNILRSYSFVVAAKNVGDEPNDLGDSNGKFTLVKEIDFSEALDEYGYNKKEYTKEDLEEIFELVESNYKFENNKTLVKK